MADDTITELLTAAVAGDELALERLYELSYEELRGLAHAVRRARSGATINTTELVHEAYLKLARGQSPRAESRLHFFRIAGRAMRQVLVDAARKRDTRRRALDAMGGILTVGGGEDAMACDVLTLDAALGQLETMSARQARVVECRFFAGLSVEDTAAALDISTPTVKRDWRVARAFLARNLAGGPSPSHE